MPHRSSKARLCVVLVVLFRATAGIAEAADATRDGPEPHYRLEASLDAKTHALYAREWLTFHVPAGETFTDLYLHLTPNAYKDEDTVFARDRRVQLTFFENPGGALPTRGHRGWITIRDLRLNHAAVAFTVRETVLAIHLAVPQESGRQVELAIEFDVKIPKIRDRFGVNGSAYAVAEWFPKLAVHDSRGWHANQRRGLGEFYSDVGSYDVALTVPRDFVVGAAGELHQQISHPDGTVTRQYLADRVRDFAWVADPRYRLTQATWRGVDVRYLYLPADKAVVPGGLALATDALEFFSQQYGPYPYGTLTIAESSAIRTTAGIEHPQIVMIADDVHRLARISGIYDTILVHEIAHQWFYGLVGNNEVDEAWLDEGFATFAARKFMTARYGHQSPVFRWPRALRFLPALTDRQLGRSLYTSQAALGFDRPVAQTSPAFDDHQAYSVAVYEKASFVLEMLEYLVGPDTFHDILATYVAEFSYRNATTDDFIRIAERVSQRDLSRFFEQWLDGTAVCDYSVEDLRAARVAGLNESSVTLKRYGEIVMPVDVRLTLENGDTQTKRWNGDEAQVTFVVTTTSPVRSVDVDPDRRLLETNRVNNHYPRRWHASVNPFSWSEEQYNVVALPYVWYRQGPEVGALYASGYQPVDVFPSGFEFRHGVIVAASHNLRSNKDRLAVSYSTPAATVGPRAFWHGNASADRDQNTVEVGLRWFLGRHFYRSPYQAIQLSFAHERRSGTESSGPNDPFDPGTIRGLKGQYAWNTLASDFYPHRGGVYEIAFETSSKNLGANWTFLRGTMRAEQYRTGPFGTVLALNAFHGVLWGDQAQQRQMLLRTDGSFIAPAFDGVQGRHLSAVNSELRMPLSVPLSLSAVGFVNVAKYWDSNRSAAGHYVEYGVALRLFDNAPFGIQISLPLWTSGSGASEPSVKKQLVFTVGRPFRRRD